MSGWFQTRRCAQLTATQEFFHRLTEDSVPAFECGQLLRSFPQVCKERRNKCEGLSRAVVLTVGRTDCEGGAAGVGRLSADRREQQRPACDGLAMMIRIG